MDGLPLALDQAATYFEETGCGLAGYLNLSRTHSADLLCQRGGQIADHPEPVATTWSLSFQRVEEANPAAADLLRLCAFLAPDAIPETLLFGKASVLPATLQPQAADPLAANATLAVLQRYSLVTRHPAYARARQKHEQELRHAEKVIKTIKEEGFWDGRIHNSKTNQS